MIGTATSAIVGMVAIWALLAYLRNNSYTVFVVYRLVLAGAVLLAIATGLKRLLLAGFQLSSNGLNRICRRFR